MGDKLVKALASNLGSASTPKDSPDSGAASLGNGPKGTDSHKRNREILSNCRGAASSSDDCCSGDLGCRGGSDSVKDDNNRGMPIRS
jgi:hypothetical protein